MKPPKFQWDGSMHIGPYRYTYQDWVNGKIDTAQLEDLLNDLDNLLSQDDYERICQEQREAVTDRITVLVNSLCFMFYCDYNDAITKNQLLAEEITSIQDQITMFKSSNPELYRMALIGRNDTYSLSYEEVYHYKKQYRAKNIILTRATPDITSPLDAIVKMKYLEWLHSIQAGKPLDTFIAYNDIIRDSLYPSNTNPNNVPPQHLDKSISYEWQGSLEEIDSLYSKLILVKCLPENTDKANFKALFEGKPLNSIQPVKWLRNLNLLAYLLDQLHKKHKFPIDTNVWSIAKRGFIGAENLIQLRTNYENNKSGKPRGYEPLDTVIASLK